MWKHTVLLVVLLVSLSAALPTESESTDNVTRSSTQNDQVINGRDHQKNLDNVNQLDDDEPVRYDGAQVWRLGFTGVREKNAVADLQHNFGNFRHFGCDVLLRGGLSDVFYCESDI